MLSAPPKAYASIEKNRLYITISGELNRKNIDKLYTEIRFCVADLRPGFAVVTDLSDCTMAALSGIPTFRKISNYLVTNEVGRVVRVVNKKKLILKQLVNFTTRMNGYKADLFNSLEEAENALSYAERRDGLRFILHQHPIKFSIGSQEGNGFLCDISISGCAIQTTERKPEVLDKTFLSMEFNIHEKMMGILEIKADVIWVKRETFGARFENMSNEQKELLRERLVYESNSELL